MWFDLSKKVHWLVALMGSCFLSIFFVTLIANYFNIKIYHDSLWGIIKTFTVLFFLPAYVGYKSMFIFGYVKDQSTLNIYAENFWGFSPITIFLPAMVGGFFANDIYKEIKNKSNEQTNYEQPQYNYVPQPSANEPLTQEEVSILQDEQQPQIVNTQQPQEIPTQVIEQNPPIKQSPQTKPKEVYTPPQNNSVSPEYLAAEQAHFNKILAAHPDAIAIVESQAFKNWVNNQSASNQSYYNKVLNNGSATQVINMFNQYKKDFRSSQNNQQTISNPPQPQKRTSQDIYEQYQKPLIPSADKPLTIQSVENMPEME